MGTRRETPRHTTVTARLPGHVRELVQKSADRAGYRSVSAYVAARLQAAAIRDAVEVEAGRAA